MILTIDDIARRSAAGDRPHWVDLGETLDYHESQALLDNDGRPWRSKIEEAAGVSRNHILRCMRAYQFIRTLLLEGRVTGKLVDYSALASESIDVIHRFLLLDEDAALATLEQAVTERWPYRRILSKYTEARDGRAQPANIRQVGVVQQARFRKYCINLFLREIIVFSGATDGDPVTPIDDRINRSSTQVGRLLNFDARLVIGKTESTTVGMRCRQFQGDCSNTPIYRFNIASALLESRFVRRYWLFISAGPSAVKLVNDLDSLAAQTGDVPIGVAAVTTEGGGGYEILRPPPPITVTPATGG